MKLLLATVYHGRVFIEVLFVGKTFVTSLYDLATAAITSSHVITESQIMLAKYFTFPLVHVAGFQV